MMYAKTFTLLSLPMSPSYFSAPFQEGICCTPANRFRKYLRASASPFSNSFVSCKDLRTKLFQWQRQGQNILEHSLHIVSDVNNASGNIGRKYLYRILLSFPLCVCVVCIYIYIYLEVRLLNHMVVLF